MRRCVAQIIAGLLVCITFAGCLIDGTLDKDGGGTMVVKVRLMSVDQFADAKKQMQSPQVNLINANLDDDKWATFNLKFADVTKLSTIQFFKRATFTLSDDEGGTKTLSVKYVNPAPAPLDQGDGGLLRQQVTFTMHLPGDVVKSNATKTDGKTVKWNYPPNEFGTKPEVILSATFKRPAA